MDSNTVQDVCLYDQHTLSVDGACGAVSIAMIAVPLNDGVITMRDVIQDGLDTDLLGSDGSGMSGYGMYQLASFYGKAETGCLGAKKDPKECKEFLLNQLRHGRAVIIGIRTYFYVDTRYSSSHAVVVAGIDEYGDPIIYDPYATSMFRRHEDKSHVWRDKAGIYTVTWAELDASWNSPPDLDDDYWKYKIFGDGHRFWLTLSREESNPFVDVVSCRCM